MATKLNLSNDRQPPVANTSSPWTCKPPQRDEHPGMHRSSDLATVEQTSVTQGAYPGSGRPGETWDTESVS